ncbi:conjugal transfer protein [Paenarthrobacter sp. NPDC090520]|uniref:conjugal transfer protein n=1 Tax=Paenarthrobacter sp. NPDC090520 TaxID=3364382 RepID=UPI0037F23946
MQKFGERLCRTKAGRVFWIHVLNMPEPGTLEPRHQPAPPAAAAPDPWAAAAQAVSQQKDQLATTPSSAWQMTERNRTATAWKRIFRTILVLVLGFAVITGVRSWFTPAQGRAGDAVPASVMFPYAAAGGVAERFAVNYFTWDEDAGAARSAALALDLANGGEGTAAGWDGKGKQAAMSPYVVGTRVKDENQATITVAVKVVPYTRAAANAKEWVPGGSRTLALEVPVQMIDGRAVVTGRPGTVALPAPGKLNKSESGTEDADLTGTTKDYAKQFFTLYAQDKDTSAIAAPNAHIAGLNGAVEFKDLTGWTVYRDGGDNRRASATVRWAMGASTIEQSFTVTLTKVTGAGAERWQISQLLGGN